MTKLTQNQHTILETLEAAGGPMPCAELAKAFADQDAFATDLEALVDTGFVSRKARSLTITEIGLAARAPAKEARSGDKTSDPTATNRPANAPTKKDQLKLLLKRPEGITVPDLASALEWLPHTTRAALTGLKKTGCVIDKLPPLVGSRSSHYRLVEAD
tara:strand:- start:8822 stop:9298 length:477 start_codon:yes stop_codon:yes gene_type:complete